MLNLSFRTPRNRLIPFITSLPPSAELLPLIQTIDPDYIFEFWSRDLAAMMSWIKVNFEPLAHNDSSDTYPENSFSTRRVAQTLGRLQLHGIRHDNSV